MKTLTICLTDATIVAGGHAELGSIHTLPEAEALQIIGAGRAVRHSPEAPTIATPAEAEPTREAAAAPAETETAAATEPAKPKRRRA